MKTTIALFLANCVISLTQAGANAEDLTTLDGNTFSNVTDIAKYPKQIFFTVTSTRKNVAITNLPEDFLAKHGIVITTEAQVVPVKSEQQQLSPIDLFLLKNKDTKVLWCEDVHIETNNVRIDWQICLQGVQVSLTKYQDIIGADIKTNSAGFSVLPASLCFHINQAEMVDQVFVKFLEWDAVARANKVQPFEKLIASYRGFTHDPDIIPPPETFTFVRRFDDSYLAASDAGGYFPDDVIHFRELLRRIPELKITEANKIRSKEAQKELFR